MILVTGGTGLVGSHLLYFLLKEERDIRAIYRKSASLEKVKLVFSYYTEEVEELFNKIDWVEANTTDVPALTDAFKGITHVYHAAAFISFNPKHFNYLRKVNIEGTANIVNLCIENKVEKLCYVSSIATLGKELDGSAISEKTEWNQEAKNSVYAITKYGAEMEIWRGSQEGLDVVIVSPGVVLGSGHWKSASGRIFSSVNKGMKYYTTGGSGFVDVYDVVKMMIFLMNSAIKNELYIAVGHNVLYKDLLEKTAKYLNKEAPKKEIAKWKLLVISSLDSIKKTLFGGKRKLLKATVHSLYTISTFNSQKAIEQLPFTFTTLDESLERISKDFKKIK